MVDLVVILVVCVKINGMLLPTLRRIRLEVDKYESSFSQISGVSEKRGSSK